MNNPFLNSSNCLNSCSSILKIKKQFYHYCELCLFFRLDSFDSHRLLFFSFSKVTSTYICHGAKTFFPLYVRGKCESAVSPLSCVIFLSSERTRTGPTTTRASNRGKPSIFSHGVIALPSLV